MNRYFSLCVFVIIFALFASIIVAAPKGEPAKGSNSDGETTTSKLCAGIKNLANKSGKALWDRIGPWNVSTN